MRRMWHDLRYRYHILLIQITIIFLQPCHIPVREFDIYLIGEKLECIGHLKVDSTVGREVKSEQSDDVRHKRLRGSRVCSCFWRALGHLTRSFLISPRVDIARL